MGILLLGRPLNAPPGSAGLNLGPQDLVACNVINIFKAASLVVASSADAALINEHGYLTSTPTGAVSMAFTSAANGGSVFIGETYRLKWPSTIQFNMRFTSSVNFVSGTDVNCTVTGGSGVGNTSILTTGGAGQVDLILNTAQPSVFFLTTGTFTHTGGDIALYRVSDEDDYNAGIFWTREYLARLRELRPAYLRPMGMVNAGGNNYNGEVHWAHRMPLTAFNWGFNRVIPDHLVGDISGTDAYTCGSYTNMPGSWTDGEVFIGYVQNTNSSTTVTLDVGGRGPKNIISRAAAAIVNTGTGSSRINTGAATFRYDGVLDAVLYSPNLYQVSAPWEAQIKLANLVNTGIWFTLPYQCTDDYVTQLATLAKNSVEKISYYEYSNEVWQNTWPQTGWCTARGAACGWSVEGNQRPYGWYGLRTAIMFKDLIPAVYGSDLATKARRVHAYQGGGFLSIVSDRFNGTMLTTGNATYNSISGSRNFNTFPDRPVDLADAIAYAPYTGGTHFCRGDDIVQATGARHLPFFQTLCDEWTLGNTATVYSMIDSDIRDLRANVMSVTATGTTFSTGATPHLLAVNDGVYFDATGGTGYSGVNLRRSHNVTSVPTSTTFTVQAYVNGNNSSVPNTNAGSAGTGTMNVGQCGRNILFTLDWFPYFAEYTAASYDAQRAGGGLVPLRADWYEGNLEPKGPTQANLDAIAIPALSGYTNAQAATIIADALDGWRFDVSAKATMKTYYKAMSGRDPDFWSYGWSHSFFTSQLVLPGPGLYGMTSGALPTSTPYQLYYGFKEFNEENPQ